MIVRAKFKVVAIKQVSWSNRNVDAEVIEMSPVYSNDPNSENKAFWDSTPSGKIEMQINNKATFGKFLAGKEYYIDFTLADQE